MYWRFEHSHPLLLECATILMVLLNLRCRFNRVSKSTVNSVWATIVREITSKWTNGKKPKKVYTYPHGRQTKQNTIKKSKERRQLHEKKWGKNQAAAHMKKCKRMSKHKWIEDKEKAANTDNNHLLCVWVILYMHVRAHVSLSRLLPICSKQCWMVLT